VIAGKKKTGEKERSQKKPDERRRGSVVKTEAAPPVGAA